MISRPLVSLIHIEGILFTAILPDPLSRKQDPYNNDRVRVNPFSPQQKIILVSEAGMVDDSIVKQVLHMVSWDGLDFVQHFILLLDHLEH